MKIHMQISKYSSFKKVIIRIKLQHGSAMNIAPSFLQLTDSGTVSVCIYSRYLGTAIFFKQLEQYTSKNGLIVNMGPNAELQFQAPRSSSSVLLQFFCF